MLHLEYWKLFYHAAADETAEENTNSQVKLPRGRPDRNRQLPARFKDCEMDMQPRSHMRDSFQIVTGENMVDGARRPDYRRSKTWEKIIDTI
ncbi:hypothetical protein AUP68_10925 [Ilyonectria robusta]